MTKKTDIRDAGPERPGSVWPAPLPRQPAPAPLTRVSARKTNVVKKRAAKRATVPKRKPAARGPAPKKPRGR